MDTNGDDQFHGTNGQVLSWPNPSGDLYNSGGSFGRYGILQIVVQEKILHIYIHKITS